MPPRGPSGYETVTSLSGESQRCCSRPSLCVLLSLVTVVCIPVPWTPLSVARSAEDASFSRVGEGEHPSPTFVTATAAPDGDGGGTTSFNFSSSETRVTISPTGTSSWGHPRLFDAFLFYNEIELLEIRIGELFDVVESFVLVETLESFQGAPKISHYDSLQFQLPAHFRKKVFHHKCKTLAGVTAWAREQSARACMKVAIFAAGARLYDLVHFNDADEIANQPTMRKVQQRVASVMNRRGGGASASKRRTLASMFPMGITLHNHYYNFRTHNLKDWHSDLFLILDVQQFLRKAKRLGGMKSRVAKGGWHCSWCFPTVAQFREKFLSFSHTETIDDRNFDANNIWNCTCTGTNIFHFRGPPLIIVKNPLNISIDAVPQYLKDHMHEPKFAFLLPEDKDCRIPLS
jgi:hypothetical protein